MLLTTCNCTRTQFVADAVRSKDHGDPTGTSVVRARYEREMNRRFRALRRQIIEAIVRLDVLGLKKGAPSLQKSINTQMFTRLFAPDKVVLDAVAKPMQNEFAFNRSGDKVASFMQWLKTAEQDGILGITHGASIASSAAQSWQNVYIDTAYQKGIRDAYSYLGTSPPGGIAAAFNQPVHADRVGLIYTRTFNELEGVTNVMSQKISRSLAMGMAKGLGPQEIANDLAEDVDNIGITRARVIARTETISAHAEASLNSYEEAGVEGVTVLAEFSTAGDDQVCPECEDLEGQEYDLVEARGIIPVHPNCRCSFVPVVKD